MATVLEECSTEEYRPVVRFLWAKGLNAKDIHTRKEMFRVYGGKCLSRKAVHNWTEKRGKHLADDERVETEVRRWLKQQSETSMLLVLGASASMLVGDISRNINVFPGSNITCFTFYIHL
jgi:hypothetical protein